MDKNSIAAVVVAACSMFIFMVFGPEVSGAMKHGGRIQGSWYPVLEKDTPQGDKMMRRMFCEKSFGKTVISEKRIGTSFGGRAIPFWHLDNVQYGEQVVSLDLKLVRHGDLVRAKFDYIDETQLVLKSLELVPSERGASEAMQKIAVLSRKQLTHLRRC